MANIAQEANTTSRNVVVYPGRDDWNRAKEAAGMDSDSHEDMHGGELGTSILLHARPELVRASFRHADHEASDRSHLHLLGMSAYTSSGIIGRPSAATDVKGKAALDALTKSFAEYFALITRSDIEGEVGLGSVAGDQHGHTAERVRRRSWTHRPALLSCHVVPGRVRSPIATAPTYRA